jgi:hypothetical protein
VRTGCAIVISWATTEGMDRRERLGLECDLIAAHRAVTKESPACQFAGMPDE